MGLSNFLVLKHQGWWALLLADMPISSIDNICHFEKICTARNEPTKGGFGLRVIVYHDYIN